MDPMSGKLYPSVADAKNEGVENPVEIRGRIEDIEQISRKINIAWTAEQKSIRNTKNKTARKSRRRNR